MREMLSAPTPPPFGSNDSFQGSRPLVRGQSSEENKPIAPPVLPTKITLPTPEELDLHPRPPQAPSNLASMQSLPARGIDWAVMRQEMDRYRAVSFRLEKTAEGAFRFICALPYPEDANRHRQFEATAATESEAMAMALEQMRQWYRP